MVVKKAKKKLVKNVVIGFVCFLVSICMALGGVKGLKDEEDQQNNSSQTFKVEWNTDLPKDLVKDIKGKGQISDDIAQLAVATAIKYKLLPSVILSQYAYKSE